MPTKAPTVARTPTVAAATSAVLVRAWGSRINNSSFVTGGSLFCPDLCPVSAVTTHELPGRLPWPLRRRRKSVVEQPAEDRQPLAHRPGCDRVGVVQQLPTLATQGADQRSRRKMTLHVGIAVDHEALTTVSIEKDQHVGMLDVVRQRLVRPPVDVRRLRLL